MGMYIQRLGALWCVLVFVLCMSFVSYAHAQATNQAPQSPVTQTDAYRAKLQAQLDDLESQITSQQKLLDATKGQDVSLQRDIKILTTQITDAKLQIKARDVAIQQLGSGIFEKQGRLQTLNQQLQNELESLGGILREKNHLDLSSLVVAALTAKSLSDFFADTNVFDQINVKLQDSFTRISNTRDITQKQKSDLEGKLEVQARLRKAQQQQQQQIASQQNQKKQILASTKGQEKAYQTLIAKNQKSATQIRAALFQLSGAAAIPFGRALDYANVAAQQTGIRPAFLLGIITEESSLGANVGKGTYKVDMHPTRDVPIFLAMAASLGFNPDTVPVSKKQWYGYGGAMGPAQFIPSTWAQYAGYVKPDYHYDQSKDRIGKKTGHTPPNPWDPVDAFTASAILLTDDGAGAQTTGAEFKAAMCYLAGCGNVNNKSLQFYAEQVASYAADYQCQINVVEGKPLTPECNY